MPLIDFFSVLASSSSGYVSPLYRLILAPFGSKLLVLCCLPLWLLHYFFQFWFYFLIYLCHGGISSTQASLNCLCTRMVFFVFIVPNLLLTSIACLRKGLAETLPMRFVVTAGCVSELTFLQLIWYQRLRDLCRALVFFVSLLERKRSVGAGKGRGLECLWTDPLQKKNAKVQTALTAESRS